MSTGKRDRLPLVYKEVNAIYVVKEETVDIS